MTILQKKRDKYMTKKLNPKNQALIDRLAAIDYSVYNLDKNKVENAMNQHLKALNQPLRPFLWIDSFKYMKNVFNRLANTDEKWSAAFDAASDKALDSIRDAEWNESWNAALGAEFNAAREAAFNAARVSAWEALRGGASDVAPDATLAAVPNAAWDAANAAGLQATAVALHWFRIPARGRARIKALNALRNEVCDALFNAALGAALQATVEETVEETVEAMGMRMSEIWFPFIDAIESGLFIYYVTKNEVICLPRPCMTIVNNKLHNEKGPAVYWPNTGEEYYFLNGVKVSKEIVMTPTEKLDAQLIVKENNAEVRREIVRKIGIERVCYKLGAECIDKMGDYELLALNLGDGRKRPYLKMRNPSIHVYHIEGVHPDCKTVAEALHFRKPEEMKKIKIDENGDDWYQQGDVCIWPNNAKSLKKYPKVLT